jgi:Calcineurin-like phosphoesterase
MEAGMTRWREMILSTTMASVVAVGALTTTASAQPTEANDHKPAFTFAVIGDIPYGDAQIARFPKVIDQINADPTVQLVDHLGDIKSGSSTCANEYFAMIKADFDRFVDPLVYTPGDNEWTDCHRPNNGSYNPLERLAKVREVFFPCPDKTLGHNSVRVWSQADQGFVENVSYSRNAT